MKYYYKLPPASPANFNKRDVPKDWNAITWKQTTPQVYARSPTVTPPQTSLLRTTSCSTTSTRARGVTRTGTSSTTSRHIPLLDIPLEPPHARARPQRRAIAALHPHQLLGIHIVALVDAGAMAQGGADVLDALVQPGVGAHLAERVQRLVLVAFEEGGRRERGLRHDDVDVGLDLVAEGVEGEIVYVVAEGVLDFAANQAGGGVSIGFHSRFLGQDLNRWERVHGKLTQCLG